MENAKESTNSEKLEMMKDTDNSKSYLWLCRTIDNCNSILQLETAERLIENFERLNKDKILLEKVSWRFCNKAHELSYFKWKSA